MSVKQAIYILAMSDTRDFLIHDSRPLCDNLNQCSTSSVLGKFIAIDLIARSLGYIISDKDFEKTVIMTFN